MFLLSVILITFLGIWVGFTVWTRRNYQWSWTLSAGGGFIAGCLSLAIFSPFVPKRETNPPTVATSYTTSGQSATNLSMSSSKESLKEQTATILNLNGHLCASVLDIKPLQVGPNMYEVSCIEYRGGSGMRTYIMDAAKGIAWRP